MNPFLAALILVASTGVAIAAMLIIRRGAPDGGYFNDGDRAAGVFGVLATGFSILLGLIVALGFTSYDTSRSGAEQEALLVAQQVETAQFMPDSVSTELTGELVCYARYVVHQAWPRMEAGTQGERLNPWGVQLFQTLQKADPESASEQAAYSKWLDQTSDREAARSDRTHGAVGVLPSPLWVTLFFISAVIVVFMLFFADSGERAIVQALLIGSVVSVIAGMLLLLVALDNPFRDQPGGLRPVAMQRTIQILDQELKLTDVQVEVPCDARGSGV